MIIFSKRPSRKDIKRFFSPVTHIRPLDIDSILTFINTIRK